jgi:hypothetical protein
MAQKPKAWIGFPPTHKAFQPYVAAIGQAAVTWNGLHEALRGLFTTIGNNDFPASSAMWYSLRSDRSQRQLIKALAQSAREHGEMGDAIFSRIEWLMKQADILADARDNAIHAPLVLSPMLHDLGAPLRVRLDVRGGHPRAKQLFNKDLLSEYRWCRDMGRTLTDFCMRLDMAICYPSDPLPEISSLPKRGQTKAPARRSSRPSRA